MFNQPIKHVPLTSVEEVIKVSFRTSDRSEPLTKCQNNGQIAFTDQYGYVYVTPYRREIHFLLEEAGYTEGGMCVPFSNGENRPVSYQWLAKIAEEENWAYTFEEAKKVADKKGIKEVKVDDFKCQVREIFRYDDTIAHTIYYGLVMKYLSGETADNVGTYIIVDTKTLVVCDEFGRTFLIKTKTVANEFVNALIEAGYTRTAHPENYLHNYDLPKTENDKE